MGFLYFIVFFFQKHTHSVFLKLKKKTPKNQQKESSSCAATVALPLNNPKSVSSNLVASTTVSPTPVFTASSLAVIKSPVSSPCVSSKSTSTSNPRPVTTSSSSSS